MPTDAELAQLRGDVMTALARIEGDVRLLIERGEQATRRADALERKTDRLDERMDKLEASAVTQEQLRQRDEGKSRRNLALAGLAMTGTGILSGAGVAFATAFIK